MPCIFHLIVVKRVVNHLVCLSLSPVASEHSARSNAEPDEQGHKRTEGEPIGIAIGGCNSLFTEAVAHDAEEYHVDNECDEGNKGGKRGEKGHKNCAGAVV